MTARPLKQVWCLLDRKAGHQGMSRGMVEALAGSYPIEVHDLSMPTWMTPVGKFLQALWPLGSGLAGRVLRPPLPPRPDLIVGSGGNTLWPTAALGRVFDCPAIFVGSRRRLPLSALRCIVHYDPDLEKQGYLKLNVLPGPQGSGGNNPGWAEFCAERGLDPQGRYLACLVGGEGSGYHWQDNESDSLADLLTRMAGLLRARLLITTSRRTARAFEEGLIRRLPRELIADACWQGRGDQRRIVATYLAGASWSMVGEDSMSMIHEALAFHRPVFTLRPQHTESGGSYLSYVEHAERSGWLGRIPLKDPPDLDRLSELVKGYPGDVHREAAEMVLERLGWKD